MEIKCVQKLVHHAVFAFAKLGFVYLDHNAGVMNVQKLEKCEQVRAESKFQSAFLCFYLFRKYCHSVSYLGNLCKLLRIPSQKSIFLFST
jgi:hypothetical protein